MTTVQISRFTLLTFLASFVLFLLASMRTLSPQQFVPNYEESKVPKYTLPDPLISQDGTHVRDLITWRDVRRPEILEAFASQVYGRSPEPIPFKALPISSTDQAIGGKAVRREVDLKLERNGKSLTLSILIYTPAGATNVPTFLGLNFEGNHALEDDPSIRIPTTWFRSSDDGTVQDHRATEKGRGTATSWPLEMILSRGYGLATIYYGDIDPDYDDGFENGMHWLFSDWVATIPADERWGSIAAWAYGLRLALDYLETDELVDGSRIAVIGHSRLGKTALWAGAQDERFKLVISNDSGCGGAALSRRVFGETVARINHAFPHWFCLNHRKYNDNEAALPVDQHQLIALIAPRCVYVASATEDRWADPKGEYLSCLHADPVFRLFGTKGLGGDSPQETLPEPESPLHEGNIGYHLRTGKHALTPIDWQYYLDFADVHLR